MSDTLRERVAEELAGWECTSGAFNLSAEWWKLECLRKADSILALMEQDRAALVGALQTMLANLCLHRLSPTGTWSGYLTAAVEAGEKMVIPFDAALASAKEKK